MNKNDLISRAYVLAEYDRQHKGPPGGARKIMEEAPAVKLQFVYVDDVVRVVRCRDCKFGKLYLDADGHSLIQCNNPNYPTANVETWPLELDWYCAGGERRDGDT